jgi:ribose transport system substrate-binding protein
MRTSRTMKAGAARSIAAAAVLAMSIAAVGTARAASTYDPTCFKPWSPTTAIMHYKAKKPPYRIALANGYVGNSWRLQMVESLRAYAKQPQVAKYIKELKIVSVGNNESAQLASIENFINQGFDAILIEAVSTKGYDRVIREAKHAGVILLPYDVIVDSNQIPMINEDQVELGKMWANWLIKQMGTTGKVLEIRGIEGTSVDRDIHAGVTGVFAHYPHIKVIDVDGKWDDGASEKAVADAISVYGHFNGMIEQAGTTGAVRALLDSHQPLIPVGGEGENGFRKQMAEYASKGLRGLSAEQAPALSAVALKAAIALLQGKSLPQMSRIPIPYITYKELKPGVNYFPKLPDNFFAETSVKACNVILTPEELFASAKS